MRDYRDLRRVYNLTLTKAFFALLEQKVLDVWETLARMGYDRHDYFDFTEKRWKALPVERQIAYASQYQRWYAERLGVGVEQSFEGIVFRLVPPGKFMMGSPKSESNRYENEKREKVFIRDPFWCGKYEVTHGEWMSKRRFHPYYSGFEGENLPVNSVSWEECSDFCAITNLELLDEKQWEYACRAGTTTAYSFGNDPDDLEFYAYYNANSAGHVHNVGEKKANGWGFHDMHGNVWEWCQNLYNDSDERVYRGGSFKNSASGCRSSVRARNNSNSHMSMLGFRVCKSIS